MPDREAFLQTICEHPDDDGPRLVMADWYEEQGNPRGEFIRLQCERLSLPNEADRARFAKREQELLNQYGKEWLDELPQLQGVVWGPPRRGFVYNLQIDTAERFLNLAETIFAAAPVVEVWFSALGEEGAKSLAESNWLTRLTTLKNHRVPIGDAGTAALVESSNSANLRRLFLNSNSITDEGARSIARSRYMQNMRLLFLHGNRITDFGARALAESTRLPNVTEIYLVQNEIHEAGIQALKARWGDSAFV